MGNAVFQCGIFSLLLLSLSLNREVSFVLPHAQAFILYSDSSLSLSSLFPLIALAPEYRENRAKRGELTGERKK